MGPRVILALALAAALVGCGKSGGETVAPGTSPDIAVDNGKGMKPQAAPELTPPPGAPTADQVVGSKAGGG